GSFLFAVTDMTSVSDDEGGITSSFGGTLTNATTLNVTATGNDTASTNIHVLALSLGAGAHASGTSTVGGSDLAYIATGSTIQSPGTVITVSTNQSSEADAGAHGGAGGLVGIAVITSNATVSRSTKAYVDHDATVGNNTGKPAALTITSYDASSA